MNKTVVVPTVHLNNSKFDKQSEYIVLNSCFKVQWLFDDLSNMVLFCFGGQNVDRLERTEQNGAESKLQTTFLFVLSYSLLDVINSHEKCLKFFIFFFTFRYMKIFRTLLLIVSMNSKLKPSSSFFFSFSLVTFSEYFSFDTFYSVSVSVSVSVFFSIYFCCI